jgi:hypothetical protein
VFVALLPRDIGKRESVIAETFRITDSIVLRRRGSSLELHAVLDHDNLDRGAVVRRVREAVGGPIQSAWATFPEDGVTIGALVEHAHAQIAGRTAGAGRRVSADKRSPPPKPAGAGARRS